ncbi:unnamed protein product [Linum trigynum]|uniref:Ubiquitin-like protease family profile domain-containing protein n=1 Tax=Linum trigynum TaxID=586398 RepID=A0AAV2E230_9ROSI
MGLLSGLISAARTTLRRGPTGAKAAVDRWAADRKIRIVQQADVSYPELRLLPAALDDCVDVEIQGPNGEIVLSLKLRIEILTNGRIDDDDSLHGGIVRKAWMAVKEWSEERIAIVGKALDEIQGEEIRVAGKIPKKHRYLTTFREQVANYAESSTEFQIQRYAYNSELSPDEVLFQDAREKTILRRMDFRKLVSDFGVLESATDLYIDHINKSSLKANNGYFKKFVFPTDLAFWLEDAAADEMDDNECLTLVKECLSTIDYIPKGEIDASKCDLWCVPLLSCRQHAVAMVINIKDACIEYLDSGGPDKASSFGIIDAFCNLIFKVVSVYIASTRRDVDFAKFEWRYPRVPCQPFGSKPCAIYRLRFLEEWDAGDGVDLRKFEGWEERYWHVKERVKICASILTDDSNAVLDEVKEKARRMHAIRKRRQLMGIVLWILLL